MKRLAALEKATRDAGYPSQPAYGQGQGQGQ